MLVKVITASGNLRVRNYPNTGAGICGRLIRNNEYEAQKEKNGWYYFSSITDDYWGTFSGWASGEFLQPVEEDPAPPETGDEEIDLRFSVKEYNELIDSLIKELEAMKR